MGALSRVVNEKTSGKLGETVKIADRGALGIGKGAESRSLGVMGKSEGGNRATNLAAIPGPSEISGSGQVWPAQNYSEGVSSVRYGKYEVFTMSMRLEICHIAQISTIRAMVSGTYESESAGNR